MDVEGDVASGHPVVPSASLSAALSCLKRGLWMTLTPEGRAEQRSAVRAMWGAFVVLEADAVQCLSGLTLKINPAITTPSKTTVHASWRVRE